MRSVPGLFWCILAISLFLSCPVFCSPFRRQVQVCNGLSELCATRYSAVRSIIGAHDSAFVGPLPSQNQNTPPTAQLGRGSRMMQVQTHQSRRDPNTVQMCHTDCRLEDAGPLVDWLTEIRVFMESPGRENEVVTILLTNPDGMPMPSFAKAFRQSGLDRICYVPQRGEAAPFRLDSWPTLGGMIQRGKRVIVFVDTGAEPGEVPYILNEFLYFFETSFETLDLLDCKIDRPSGARADGRMYIVNRHPDREFAANIFVPDRGNADITNSKKNIENHIRVCQGLYNGRQPNFVLLDFVDRGDWSPKAIPAPGVGKQTGNAACGLLSDVLGLGC